MSNTPVRIISAVVMIAFVILSLYVDINIFKGFLLVVGILVIDELIINFIKKRRVWIGYLLTQASFIATFSYVNYLVPTQNQFVVVSVVLNLFLLLYLFFTPLDSKIFARPLKKVPIFLAAYLFFSLYPITWLVSQQNWAALLCTYFVINFGMDTGGWFFGKNWGRHKLWAAISPKKTVEGFAGGILAAGFLGILSWNYFFNEISVKYFIVFCVLGLLSQLGDLVQSKIKRQVGIKDSSNIIPGHGGVFDRIDSLIFMVPFFVSFIWFL